MAIKTIRDLAEQHRLRVNDKKLAKRYRLSWAEDVVPGRYGELAELNGEFRVRFLAVPRSAVMTGALRGRYRQALDAGLRLLWKGDSESRFEFDPNNEAETALVIRLVGARIKRKGPPVTQETLARLATARATRQNAPLFAETLGTATL